MIKIGIIDDKQIYLDMIKDILDKHYDNIRTYSYNSINDLNEEVDFLLLDIDMPDVDGIMYSKQHLDKKILFVTNYDTRMKEAFGPNVYGYISKDNLKNELVSKVNEMIEIIKKDFTVTFKIDNNNVNIKVNDIVYFQYIRDHCVAIVCNNKSMEVKGTSLKKIIEILGDQFVEIDRKTCINKSKITNFYDGYVYLQGTNTKLKVSIRKYNLIKKYFFESL